MLHLKELRIYKPDGIHIGRKLVKDEVNHHKKTVTRQCLNCDRLFDARWTHSPRNSDRLCWDCHHHVVYIEKR